MLARIIVLALAPALAAELVRSRPAEDTIVFSVNVPATAEQVYLAGTFNGWQPGDDTWKLAPGKDHGAKSVRRFSLAVERARLGPPPVEFKFTRGSWETVEVAINGQDVKNRTLRAADLTKDALTFHVPRFKTALAREEIESTVVGRLDVFEVASEGLGNRRKVRVWLPPGYEETANQERRYPLLLLHDGQNVFDAATSFKGLEWQADETATRLIEAGRIEPLVIVGVDNTGRARAAEYNSPRATVAGARARGDAYVAFLRDELLPRLEGEYRLREGAEHRACGGSSFGGNITLFTLLEAPGLFGAALVESPASWYGGGVLLEQMAAREAWTERVFIGVGTKETGRLTRDLAYVQSARGIESVLRKGGLDAEDLHVVVEEGARHEESAWARRLPGALEFLFGVDGENDSGGD